jgi:hypothetical protein
MGINYFYVHFRGGGVRGILCHGIKKEGIVMLGSFSLFGRARGTANK